MTTPGVELSHAPQATAGGAAPRPPGRTATAPRAAGSPDPQAARPADELAGAVATLPALSATKGDRYAPRPLTVAWLLSTSSSNTRRAYFADLAAWLAWCERWGVAPLAARRADADVWAASLVGARRTVARRLAGVSSWYRYLVANAVLERNPFATVGRPAVHRDHSPTVGLTASEAAELLAAADRRAAVRGSEAALREAALLALLLGTGLRVGGVLAADLDDLGHDAGHRVLSYVNKGGHRRRVAVPPPVAGRLDAYLASRAARLGCSPAELSGPLLVTAPHGPQAGGRRLTQRDAWNALRRAGAAAGLPAADRLSPHSARRTFATLALAGGARLEQVQDALGHDDPRTTRGYDDDRHRLDGSPGYAVAAALTAGRASRSA